MKRALVTGATSGIGRAFAQRLARDGCDLILVARSRSALEEFASELESSSGVSVETLACDLGVGSQLAQVERKLADTTDLDLLVNNAGFLTQGDFGELDRDREEELVRVMGIAVMRLTHAVIGGMRARGSGAVLNVSSRAAFGPAKRTATYSATKAFVNSLTVALASELAGTGVRVHAVCPGNVRTEIFERAGRPVPTEAIEPEAVVDHALAELARGAVVSVPGERSRDRWLRRNLPQRLLTKCAAVFRRLSGL